MTGWTATAPSPRRASPWPVAIGRALSLNRIYPALYVIYMLVGITLRWGLWPAFPHGWIHIDHIWYVSAARSILDGSWRIYDFRPDFTRAVAPPDGLAYSYSPLPALIMSPFVALADALANTPLAAAAAHLADPNVEAPGLPPMGPSDALANRLIAVPLLLIDVLAVDQLRRLVREWRPQISEGLLLAAILPTLLITGLLQVSAWDSHHEGLVLLLLLLTLRVTPRNTLLGGVLAGLTLAAKQPALLLLLPIAAVMFISRDDLRRAVTWALAAVASFFLVLLPSLIAEPDAVFYAFWTQEQHRILFGQGLPNWIGAALAAQFGLTSSTYTTLYDLLRDFANVTLVAVVAAVSLFVVWRSKRDGQPIGLRDTRLLALIALAALLQLLLGKWNGMHYYPVPLALLMLWDLVRSAPRPPVLGLVGAFGYRLAILAFYGTSLVHWPPDPEPLGAVLLALLAFMAGACCAGAIFPSRRDPEVT